MKNLILTLILSLFVSISFSQGTLVYTIEGNTGSREITGDTIEYFQQVTDITYEDSIYVTKSTNITFENTGDNEQYKLIKLIYIDDELMYNSNDNIIKIDTAGVYYLLYNDKANGFSYVIKIVVVEGTASTDELVKEDIRLSVYPNPVQDIVNVEFTTTQRLSVELYTLSGQLILSETNTMIGDNKVQLNMYDLPSGMYLIKVGNETFRTVKQ